MPGGEVADRSTDPNLAGETSCYLIFLPLWQASG